MVREESAARSTNTGRADYREKHHQHQQLHGVGLVVGVDSIGVTAAAAAAVEFQTVPPPAAAVAVTPMATPNGTAEPIAPRSARS